MIKLINILSEIKIIPNITPKMVWKLYNDIISLKSYQNSDDNPKNFINILEKYFQTSLTQSVLKDREEVYKLSSQKLNNLYKDLLKYKDEISTK